MFRLNNLSSIKKYSTFLRHFPSGINKKTKSLYKRKVKCFFKNLKEKKSNFIQKIYSFHYYVINPKSKLVLSHYNGTNTKQSKITKLPD